jgi:hypothetical protein
MVKQAGVGLVEASLTVAIYLAPFGRKTPEKALLARRWSARSANGTGVN